MNTLSRYTERLAQLVALPSVSSATPKWDMSNRKVIELLAGWLGDLGFAIEIQEIPGYPTKANLIATLGSGPGGLVLAGHTDTVPFDEQHWQQDPFTLTERNRALFGLGATDMKGFFPVVLAAVEQLANTPLQQPLIILATADEESSMAGARHLAATGQLKARYAVIGEPTGLKPVRMHKGIMMEAVRIQGLAGHSSDPSLGNSALEAMQRVMSSLLDYRQTLQAKHKNPGFEVEVPTLNLGSIHGGDNPNRICGHCELHFDLRPLPGMKTCELHQQIDELLEPIRQETKAAITLSPLFDPVEPFEEDHASPLVKAAERLSGSAAQSVGFATEAAFMQALGMQTIVYGPGSIDQAHQPNEFIELGQVSEAIGNITALIHEFCVTPAPIIG